MSIILRLCGLFFFVLMNANVMADILMSGPDGQYQIVLNKNQMQISLIKVDKNEQLDFKWKKNEYYSREITATKFVANKQDNKKGASVVISTDEEYCLGFWMPEYVREAFKQIQNGGSVFRMEQTVEDYLKAYPLPGGQYNLAVNKELTKKYGVGFSSQIYNETIRKQQKNRDVEKKFVHHLLNPNLSTLSERIKGLTAFVLVGINGNPTDVTHESEIDENFERGLAYAFKNLGIKFFFPEIKKAGLIEENVAMWYPKFLQLLRSGEDVILMGGSRGFLEILLAMKMFDEEKEVFPGKVGSIISCAGLLSGVFILDFLFENAPWVVDSLTDKNNLPTFKQMRSSNIDLFTKELRHYLPKNIPYLNLVGILPGNGLSEEKIIKKYQDKIREFLPSYGANDGYIEYPGTEIPNEWNLQNYTLVMKGSHLVMDGIFEAEVDGKKRSWGSDPREKILMTQAIISTILELMGR